jgi:hypothetical protein
MSIVGRLPKITFKRCEPTMTVAATAGLNPNRSDTAQMQHDENRRRQIRWKLAYQDLHALKATPRCPDHHDVAFAHSSPDFIEGSNWRIGCRMSGVAVVLTVRIEQQVERM